MFKTLKVNYKFKQGQAEHLVYVLVVLIVFILISLVCINSYHGRTETVYLNRFFNLREKTLNNSRGLEWHQQGNVCGTLLVISAMDGNCEW